MSRSGHVYSYCRDHENERQRNRLGIETQRGSRESLPMPRVLTRFGTMPDINPMTPEVAILMPDIVRGLRG